VPLIVRERIRASVHALRIIGKLATGPAPGAMLRRPHSLECGLDEGFELARRVEEG